MAVVAAVVVASGLWLWGAAWHIDEPFFLAIARQILRDPYRPLAFDFNWYGWTQRMAQINNTPPLLPYLLAGALKAGDGGEFLTRALFLPFDLAAAWALLALAARHLRRPLWPVLCVLLGPAWLLNEGRVMAERVMCGFALPSLWLFCVGVDDGDARAFWASAALAALALLSKHNAVFIVPAALAYGWARGGRPARLVAWAAVAASGTLSALAWSRGVGGDAGHAAWSATAGAFALSTSGPAHRLRALLSFAGGLAPAVALGGFALRPSRRALVVCAGSAALLFGPWFDLGPVRLLDRVEGAALGGGAALAVWVLARAPRERGAPLWGAWAASVAVLNLVYWAVVARFVVFLVPPLVFWIWERLESEGGAGLDRLGRVAAGSTLLLGLAVTAVDRTYADAQRRVAAQAAAEARALGAPLWYWGHWGLQEYLSREGARQLDSDRGGWEQVRPGDLVLVSEVNTNRIVPARPIPADSVEAEVGSAVPVRHLAGWRSEAGFYSSGMGFLPWVFSRAPVDSFRLLRRR